MSKDFNEVKDDVVEKIEDIKEDVQEKLEEVENEFKAKRAALRDELKARLAPVAGFFDKVKFNFGLACNWLDEVVFARSRKSHIALVGFVIVLLIWIF